MILRLRWWVGRFLNLCGFASPIRECEYEASICTARITVKQTALSTLITVNGLDIYFDRLSGRIYGVGLIPNADSQQGAIVESIHLGELPANEPELPRTETPPDSHG